MKGQISLIEAVTASVALFIAFNIMINTQTFQSKWNDAILALNGRDILTTVDRSGKLYTYSFSQSSFNNEFLSKLDVSRDSIIKTDTQGALKSSAYVACNCTQAQATYIQNALASIQLNGRAVNIFLCPTTLSAISPCTSTQQYPDILVIWGYKDLQPNLQVLQDLVSKNVGIIEIADMQPSQVDAVQQQIFGLKSLNTGNFPGTPDQILKPSNASILAYQSYKWFYHVPYLLTASITNSIPIENGIQPCTSSATTGNFNFQNTNHKFWVCGTASVYLDTNGNNIADKIVTPGNAFSIGTFNFKLNSIDSSTAIRISFKPTFSFIDFVSQSNANKLFPIDDNPDKVFISSGFWDANQQQPIAVAIFNGTENVKTVWLADFSRNGLTNTGDDHKQLVASLILSMVNKNLKDSTIQGQITSYINTLDNDIFEVYRIDMKIVKPF